jgi:hypothetical protein
MLLSAVAMVMFTAWASTPLRRRHPPGLLVMGLGLGLVFAPAMSTATLGVDRADAGVASALVNTGQQIGGSIGTALLSTLAASAASGFADRPAPSRELAQAAAVHGYTTAFLWSAAIFAIGALVSWDAALARRAERRRRGARRSWCFAH